MSAVSPYGDAGDALDFALDHIDDPFERLDFLECWRSDDLEDWPEYHNWLHIQRVSAASAIEAPSGGETHSGSTEGESAAPNGGDAQ